MNNRLEAARAENKKLRDQLQETQANIIAEKQARPDSVSHNVPILCDVDAQLIDRRNDRLLSRN